MANDEAARPGNSRGDRVGRLRATAFAIRRSSFVILLLLLAGCGGAFQTSTPTYARYTSGAVFKEFKAQGLRVDGVRDMTAEDFGPGVPRHAEAKGFLCGPNGTATATLFTFDSSADLAAMADFVKKKYGARQRQLAHQNALLVFWLPSKDDTVAYDSAFLTLR